MNKRRIAILGSTGSIGTQTLDVISKHKDLFEVELLTANNNADLLIEQAILFNPNAVIICNKALYKKVNEALKPHYIKVFSGIESVIDVLSNNSEIDLVVAAMVGFSGLEPTLAALRSGKAVALANKETLVVAGALVTKLSSEKSVPIIPVDSEHSAIFQALQGERSKIEKILLTASGGPFFSTPLEQLNNVTIAEALNHPKWNMGAKVSIDSATMMNKGFEMIEAKWLFNVSPSQIEIVVHPQSIVHSMVQFEDGSIIAQMSNPDMRIPIQYALSYPYRLPLSLPRIDFSALSSISFFAPDTTKFKAIGLAYQAIEKGGNMPCIMNAANEIAVSRFLSKEISFQKIPAIVEESMENCTFVKNLCLDTLIETDKEARLYASTIK